MRLRVLFNAVALIVALAGPAFASTQDWRGLSAQARMVNDEFNAYEYKPDDGQEFTNCLGFALNGGDCEEFALCKADKLNRLNPSHKAYAQLVTVKTTGQQHAITVFQDDGKPAYLDNRAPYGGSLSDAQRLYHFKPVRFIIDNRKNAVVKLP